MGVLGVGVGGAVPLPQPRRELHGLEQDGGVHARRSVPPASAPFPTHPTSCLRGASTYPRTPSRRMLYIYDASYKERGVYIQRATIARIAVAFLPLGCAGGVIYFEEYLHFGTVQWLGLSCGCTLIMLGSAVPALCEQSVDSGGCCGERALPTTASHPLSLSGTHRAHIYGVRHREGRVRIRGVCVR